MTPFNKPFKKPQSSYSKVGCIQCKKAHRKCNEKTPKCERCERKSLNCVYPPSFIVDNGSGMCEFTKIPKIKKNIKLKTNQAMFSAFTLPISKTRISNSVRKLKKHNNEMVQNNMYPDASRNKPCMLKDNMQLLVPPFEVKDSLENTHKNTQEGRNSMFSVTDSITTNTGVSLEGIQNMAQSSYSSSLSSFNLKSSISLEELISIAPADMEFLGTKDIDNDDFNSTNDEYTPYPFSVL